MINKQTGQSLVEILIALAIASLVILGIVKVTTVSVKNAGYSQDQSVATTLAQKKMTEIINEKNTNPNSFFLSSPPLKQELIENGKYCRKTSVSINAEETIGTIAITVYWGEDGIGSDCEGKKYLYNYSIQSDVGNF